MDAINLNELAERLFVKRSNAKMAEIAEIVLKPEFSAQQVIDALLTRCAQSEVQRDDALITIKVQNDSLERAQLALRHAAVKLESYRSRNGKA